MNYGWLKDRPDIRDFPALESPMAKPLLSKQQHQPRVDLRETGFFSPVEDQGDLGSCTAQAITGILEYSERKSYNNYIDHSRLFLYRVARKMLFKVRNSAAIGDTGCEVRTVIKTLAAIGSPPEWIWPYKVSEFDKEPTPDAYALAQAYKGLNYVRLENLAHIKATLRNKLPVVFGFTCYESINGTEVDRTGYIPIPQQGERVDGGHAVVGAGYDDDKNSIIIRNSWGTGWGERGYGYLPYWYFDSGQADDFWVLLRSGWVDF